MRRLKECEWLPNLLLRLSVGFMFFSGAVGKLADPTLLTSTLRSAGIPFAGTVSPVLTVVELAGGALLMLGLGTRVVSGVLGSVMVGALVTAIAPPLLAKSPNPWEFLSSLFYQAEWLMIGLFAWLGCAGAGRISIDALFAARRSAAQHPGPDEADQQGRHARPDAE
nr:DoxX family protein [Pseudonocardia spinosispora]